MKTKLPKILSVALTAVLLASLMIGAAVPASAAAGNVQWAGQPLPGVAGYNVLLNGSDVTDMAVAPDGSTVYAINGAVATGAVYRSVNAGQSFTLVAAPAAVALTAIAVASDDVNAIAVTDGATVYTSNNGGTTWATLPAFVAPVGTAQDVAVGPLRAGTLLGREYAVALADPAAAATALGTVQLIGATAAWANVAAVNTTNDYMAVAFTPGFLGDRCLVAVGSSATFAKLQILNTATNAIVSTTIFGTTTIDYRAAGAVTFDIVAADIALPSDFDPTTASGRRSYVGIAAAATFTDNDAYRVDAGTFRALGAVTTQPINSMAFSGTIDEGTLFAGVTVAAPPAVNVKYTTQPTVSLPTWVSTKKAPTGVTAPVVRVAADFATTSRMFVGTTGLESAFSVSNNAGVSFDGESLIDSGFATVVAIQDVQVTSDGATVFLATDDATELSLWKSSSPPSPTSWSRVFCVAGTAGMVRLSPDWADAPAVYFADLVAGGNIYYSGNGGDIFATRLAPALVTITGMAVEDASTIYIGDGIGAVRKSTSSAWTWGLPKPGKAGAIVSLASAGVDNLLVGGTNACSYSTDGGAAFTSISTGLAAATYTVLPDEDYATNNIIYAGSSVGDTYRFEIGTSSAWEDLADPTAAAIVGLAMNNGALYVMSAAACDRTLGPHDAAGTITWRTMNIGTQAAVASFSAVNNVAYAANGVTSLWAYNDWLATTKPVITSPGDGYGVPVDPTTGNAALVMLGWESVGTGTGLVNNYLVAIWETSVGIAGAQFIPTGVLAIPTAPTVDLGPAAGNTVTYTMRANTDYTWMIRARDEVSTDNINSQWSAPRALKVEAGVPVTAPYAGPTIFSPAPGAMSMPLRPGFSWAPLPGATKYEFELSTKSGTTARGYFVDVLASATGDNALYSTAWECDRDLDYSTTYYWHVKAVAPNQSPWVSSVFTTLSAPAAPEPPPPPPPPTPEPTTPGYIWAVICIGAALCIAVVVLIVKTRRVA